VLAILDKLLKSSPDLALEAPAPEAANAPGLAVGVVAPQPPLQSPMEQDEANSAIAALRAADEADNSVTAGFEAGTAFASAAINAPIVISDDDDLSDYGDIFTVTKPTAAVAAQSSAAAGAEPPNPVDAQPLPPLSSSHPSSPIGRGERR